MIDLIIFFLSTIGFTVIVTKSKITKPFRDWTLKYTTLFKCPLCFGFWSGIIIYFLPESLDFIKYGFSGSFICYLSFLLTEDLVKKHD
jgi:hypothetical protein